MRMLDGPLMSLMLASWPSGIMVWPMAGTSTCAAIACGSLRSSRG